MGNPKAFLTVPRVEAGYRPINDRIHDFGEVEQTLNTHDRKELLELIRQHYLHTGSALAGRMLDDWQRHVEDFIQVVPIEYKRVLQEEQMAKLSQKIAEVQRDY